MVRADIATIVEGMNWVIQHSKDPWLVSSNILALQSLTGDKNAKGTEDNNKTEDNENPGINYDEFMFFGLALFSALTVTSLTVVPIFFNSIYM